MKYGNEQLQLQIYNEQDCCYLAGVIVKEDNLEFIMERFSLSTSVEVEILLA